MNRLTSKQLEGGNKLSKWIRRKSFDENNNQTVIHSKVESYSLEKLCQEFGRILGGKGILTDENVCLVQFRDIDFTIEDVPTRSPLVNPQFFTFEIRGEEINPLLTELRDQDITVTAVHNHWLFDNPRTLYIHFQSPDDNPLEFARDVREVFKVLKK